MKKRLLSLALCLGVCLSLMTTAVSAAGFSDVKSTAYYAEPVAWAVSQDITGGTTPTTFSPNNTCSRAHIITFLWRAAGSPDMGLDYNPFRDVAETAYYYKAAVWAMVCGIQSAEGGYFNPATPCTRLAALEYIWRYAGSPAAERVAFTDLPADANAATAISWGVRYGVTGGKTSTTFVPKETCTRAQIVTFLYRYFVAPISYQGDDSVAPSTPESAVPSAPAQPSAPAKPSGSAGSMKLDPLPPEDYAEQPDWYETLTAPTAMNNARLVAEYEQIEAVMAQRWASGTFMSDEVYSREFDLESELSGRCDIVAAHDSDPSGAKQAYDALVAKFGDVSALRAYVGVFEN